MRIAFLAKRHSIHTVRWVNALADRGHEVHLLSSVNEGELLSEHVHFHPLPFPPPLGFFLNSPSLRRQLKAIQPEVLNTHFASGYGTLGRLSGFHPNVLSVWGSDVYDFPSKSVFHSWLIRKNLRSADWVSSTSTAMAKQTASLYPLHEVRVVPFGIDTMLFSPTVTKSSDDALTIGTVKTLASKYGVDLLLHAFAELQELLAEKQPGLASRLRLLIVGSGPEEASLRQLAWKLGISDVSRFTGQVPHREVPGYLQRLDIYVALSRLESFGVAVLEASSCALPVVVSDAGGLPEVVLNGETGLVVPKENASAAAMALAKLAVDAELRIRMGQTGRLHVENNYTWTNCVERMEALYLKALEHAK